MRTGRPRTIENEAMAELITKILARAGRNPLERALRGSIVGVERRLLRLARTGTHEEHPAGTEPDVSDLHQHRPADWQHHFVAQVE